MRLHLLPTKGIIENMRGGDTVLTGTAEKLREICQVIDETVAVDKIYLFGSYAYGQPDSDSDYDLCVVIPDGTMRPADAVKDIRRALCEKQDMPLDVIVYHTSQFRRRQETASLERKIVREGVLLHERQRAEQGMV